MPKVEDCRDYPACQFTSNYCDKCMEPRVWPKTDAAASTILPVIECGWAYGVHWAPHDIEVREVHAGGEGADGADDKHVS